MRLVRVRELMIPLEKYATVSRDATLREAILALDEAQQRIHENRHPHRAVLVLDKAGEVVGKLSQLDVLRALEKPYREITSFDHSMKYGFDDAFIKSVANNYHRWQKPLDDLFRKAGKIRVKDVMYTPETGEYVAEDASVDEAIYHLVTGHHQSLLVTQNGKVVGVLRLSDVFAGISALIKTGGDSA